MGLQSEHRKYHANFTFDFVGFLESNVNTAGTFTWIYPWKNVLPFRELLLHGHRIQILAPTEGKNSRINFRKERLGVLARKSRWDGHNVPSEWKPTRLTHSDELWKAPFPFKHGHTRKREPRQVRPYHPSDQWNWLLQTSAHHTAPSGRRVSRAESRIPKDKLAQNIQNRRVHKEFAADQAEKSTVCSEYYTATIGQDIEQEVAANGLGCQSPRQPLSKPENLHLAWQWNGRQPGIYRTEQ